MESYDVNTVRQLIDSGFGEWGNCPIDFHKFATVLYILARQLDVLKRQFRIQVVDRLRLVNLKSTATFTVQEIKIRTKGKRGGRHGSKGRRNSQILPPGGVGSSSMERLSSDNLMRSKKQRRIVAKDSDKMSPSERRRAGKNDDEMSPSERRRAGKYDDEMSSSERRRAGKYDDEMSPSERRRGGKYDDKMSPSERRRAGKYDDEMSPSERPRGGKYDDKMSPSERRKAGKYDDKISPSERRRAGKYDDEMSPSERRRGGKYDDEMSPSERRRAGKYDDEMSPSEQRRGGKYDDKTSPSERRRAGKYDDEMSPSERRRGGKYDDEMSSSERRRGGKYDDEMSSSERRRGGKYDDEMSLSERRRGGKYDDEMSSSERRRGGKDDDGFQRKGGKYDALDFEDDMEEQHEKIFIVTRTASGREIRQYIQSDMPVVTLEQFNDLVEKTRALQTKFGITSMMPSDWNDLRQPTSMSDPKTALNLSARLDAAERRLARLMDILTQVASHVPGIDLDAVFDERFLPTGANKDSEGRGLAPPFSETHESSRATSIYGTTSHSQFASDEDDESNFVTQRQLDEALKEIFDEALKHGSKAAKDTIHSIRNLDADISKNELQMYKVTKKVQDLHKLHDAVDNFGDKIVDIDQRLNSETGQYQEIVSQMEGDLEMALDKLYEDLAAPHDDPAAVAEITESFKLFQIDLQSTKYMQLELQQELTQFSINLKKIIQEIEVLRMIKSDRTELVQALSEKISLMDLNGLLTQVQFAAIHSDFVQSLQNIDYKVHSQECDWQKAIDEVYETNRACVDITQMDSLAESIRVIFEMLNKKVHDMFDIVGPLRTKLSTNKKLDREGNCLSCGSPVNVKLSDIEMMHWKEMYRKLNPKSVPKVEEKRMCIPGQPITHPLDQNSFICEYDCGDYVNTDKKFGLLIKELTPHHRSQASFIETQKVTRVESHTEWCLCETCSYLNKMHAAT